MGINIFIFILKNSDIHYNVFICNKKARQRINFLSLILILVLYDIKKVLITNKKKYKENGDQLALRSLTNDQKYETSNKNWTH